MKPARRLRIVKETLGELRPDELASIGAGAEATDLCNPCFFTWSCGDIKTWACTTFSVRC